VQHRSGGQERCSWSSLYRLIQLSVVYGSVYGPKSTPNGTAQGAESRCTAVCLSVYGGVVPSVVLSVLAPVSLVSPGGQGLTYHGVQQFSQ